MAAAEGVPLSGAELALIRSVPTVLRERDYAPSIDDPEETRKPRVAEIFDDEVQPQCDGGLALTSIRAPPGYGKTYLLKELICRYAAKLRSIAKGSGQPLLVLMVTALRNVNAKLRVDVSEQLKRANLRASVSFYAEDSGRGRDRDDKWWQPPLGGRYDVLVRITSCNSIVRSVQGGVRPHLLLIDESEHAVAYSATAGTLGGTVYHGRVAPLHEEVCQALWSAAAKTRFEVVLVDRDAGFNARLCAASVALQCVIQARQRGRTLARSLSYRDLRLTVRIPRSYVVLPAGDDDVLLALLRELVIDKGERVIVADMSAKHAKDLDRRLRSAIADEHQPDGPYPNVGLLHGKLDKNFLNFVASDPLRYCTRELIAALIHTPVLSRGSSLDVPYFDCNVLVARACASRNEAAQGEDRQRLTRSQLETGMRTTYIQFSRSMMTSPELVHYFADVTLGVALYACNERLLQQHREADSVPSAMVHALQSLRAVQYDATDGRPYIELSSRIAITALINIAREWLARQLHYHVFLQECRDDGATVSDLPDAQLAVLRESASRQGDADSNRKAVVYDELCKAPLNERDDVKIAGLCALGLRRRVDDREEPEEPEEPEEEEGEEEVPQRACEPNAEDAPRSPTFMQHLVEGDIEHDMQKMHAFMTHQGDSNADLVARVQQTCRQTATREPVRLQTVDRRVQTPMAASERISTVTEVLMAIAILRALGIADVHQLVPLANGRRHCPFKANRFDDAREVRDPWPPHAVITGEQLRARLAEHVPQLKAMYRAYGDIESPSPKRFGALLRSIVNNVLGCELVGARSRVDARQLHYKAAMMAGWARGRQLALAPQLVGWLDSLGDVWQAVFDVERRQAFKPLTPFSHPAHARTIQRQLADFRVPPDPHSPAAPPPPRPLQPRIKRARLPASEPFAAAHVGSDDESDQDFVGAPSDDDDDDDE
jgi:hypothetical protein